MSQHSDFDDQILALIRLLSVLRWRRPRNYRRHANERPTVTAELIRDASAPLYVAGKVSFL